MNKIFIALVFVAALLFSGELFPMDPAQPRDISFPFGLRWLSVRNRTYADLARIDFFCEPEAIGGGELIQWGPVGLGEGTIVVKPFESMKSITLFVHTANKKFAQLGPILFNAAKSYLVLFRLDNGIRARLVEPDSCVEYDANWNQIP